MKTRRIVPTTLQIMLTKPGAEDKPTLMIMNVANIVDENGFIVEYHTISVNFYGNPLSVEEKIKIERLVRNRMDSSNPESWAKFGNRKIC